MGNKNYREYTPEFKQEALELLKRGDKNSRQIERELGMTPGLLLKWRDRYQIVKTEGQPAQVGPVIWRQPRQKYVAYSENYQT